MRYQESSDAFVLRCLVPINFSSLEHLRTKREKFLIEIALINIDAQFSFHTPALKIEVKMLSVLLKTFWGTYTQIVDL